MPERGGSLEFSDNRPGLRATLILMPVTDVATARVVTPPMGDPPPWARSGAMALLRPHG